MITVDWLLENGVSRAQIDAALSPPTKGEPPHASPPLRPARVDSLGSAGVSGVPVAGAAGEAVKPRRGRMNKLETRFASEVLDARLAAKEIDGYEFEGVKLRLASPSGEVKSAWYTPDFPTWQEGDLVVYEVKGFWREAGRLRLKFAAQRFPFITFIAVQRKKGVWLYERFS